MACSVGHNTLLDVPLACDVVHSNPLQCETDPLLAVLLIHIDGPRQMMRLFKRICKELRITNYRFLFALACLGDITTGKARHFWASY